MGIWGNKKNNGPSSVNFHKKLKDEFDRYERYIKEQHEYTSESYISPTKMTKSSHIK